MPAIQHDCSVTEEDGVVTVVVTVCDRPWTMNAERKGNRWQRADLTKKWRTMFALVTKAPCVLTEAAITVEVELKGPRQDVGACLPAAKAAIDGMVDAGLFVDDNPEHVRSLTFAAPTRARDGNVFRVTVKGRKHAGSEPVHSQ